MTAVGGDVLDSNWIVPSVFILNISLDPDWIRKKLGVVLTEAVIKPADIAFEDPIPENEPENEPVNEVAIIEPVIFTDPETRKPFFTINSPAMLEVS